MAKTKHGMALMGKQYYAHRHPVYTAWVNMRQRCNNSNKWDYKHYGGRGIKVCKRWDTFKRFYEDMGAPPKGYTLDRIDNDKDYKPSNCRWSSRKEQSNNRNYNRFITYNGRKQSVGKWAEEIEIDITTKNLYHRIFDRGWSVERAFTQPLKKRTIVD